MPRMADRMSLPEVTVNDGLDVCRARWRWPRALLAGLALAGPCAAGAPPARPVLTLCFEQQDVRPWRNVDGSGLNFELLKEVGSRLDIRLNFLSMPWKRCLAQLKANDVDGAFAVSYKDDRLALGAFPGGAPADPARRMHIDRYMLVRRKGSPVDWDGKAFHHVDGPIGFQLGYSVGDFLRALRMDVDEGNQRAGDMAQKLVAGRLAAAAVGGSDAAALMKGPLAGQIEVLATPLVEKPYYLMLSHALLARDAALAERIWKSVEEVRNSAPYKKRLHELGGERQ